MKKTFRPSGAGVKLPQRNKEGKHDQYWSSGKGVAVCPECHNTLYKKEWHHPLGTTLEQAKFAKKGISFKICPACKMIKDHVYEGEIKITNVPAKFDVELVRLLTSYNARAQKNDPQDRIIEIKKQKRGYWITTTENQLAVTLAKKIKRVFNKVDVKISYSREPYEVGRITVNFL